MSEYTNTSNSSLILQSFLWKSLSCASFAMINGCVKFLSGGSPLVSDNPLPIFVIIFFQNLFASLILMPNLIYKKEKIFNLKYVNIHATRVLSAVCGIGFWYLTLKHFPVAQSVALSFLGPILTILGAIFLLKEKLSLTRIASILLSFFGALTILKSSQPFFNGNLFNWIILLPLASSSTLVISKLSTKKLTSLGENPEKLTAFLIIFMTPVSFLFALNDFVLPSLSQVSYLVLLGCLSVSAHFSFSKAYSLADVTFLMPFGFTKLLFSAAVGYLAFSEIPNSNLWLGFMAITCSTVFLSLEKKA